MGATDDSFKNNVLTFERKLSKTQAVCLETPYRSTKL